MKRGFLAAGRGSAHSGRGTRGGRWWPRGDLVVMATGADAGGEPMTLACELDFAAVPSNRFTGACQISVGPDHVLLGGMDVDGVPILTVVLNGEVTVHGVAQAASGRFRQLESDGSAGFPMLIEIDPLSRAWAIRGDTPGGLTPDDQPRPLERGRDRPGDAHVIGPGRSPGRDLGGVRCPGGNDPA